MLYQFVYQLEHLALYETDKIATVMVPNKGWLHYGGSVPYSNRTQILSSPEAEWEPSIEVYRPDYGQCAVQV